MGWWLFDPPREVVVIMIGAGTRFRQAVRSAQCQRIFLPLETPDGP